MRPWLRLLLTGLALLLAVAPARPLGAEDLATALVRDTSERMLRALEQRRAEIDRNPSLIYELVEDIVVPHFDFERITQSALGRYWREATPAQREALVGAFRQVLVRTYARALLSYSGEQIRYLPVRPGRQADSVTVSTEVRGRGSPPVPIDYRLYLKGGTWKVYDVVVDNVSLVSNYRNSFAAQVREGGIEGLIARLREMNARGQG